MKYITIISLFLLTLHQAIAQPGRSKNTTGKHLYTANRLLERSSYYNAITYIEQALVQNPGKISTIHLLADTYRKARDYANAEDYYGLLINSKDPAVFLNYPLIRLDYADALKQNNQYKRAIEQYETFAKAYNGKDRNLYANKARIEIEGCTMAMNAETPIISVQALNANVNSGYTDYAPMPVGDSLLLFSSIRSKQLVSTEFSDYARSKIYAAERISTTQWKKAKTLRGKFANSREHIGHSSYSPDGKRFYYTRCPAEEDMQVKCKIYVSERQDNVWETASSIREINIAGHKSSTPFITTDNRGTERIYFSSDRPNGKGGLDIWYVVRRSDGSYSKAVNFSSINTPYDETTPYYDITSGNFYFSSNGYPGFGGLDIFEIKSGEGSDVQNMGKPINSNADDTYYIKSKNGKYSYLVSNRNNTYNDIASQTCCDNIYAITYGVADPEPYVPVEEDGIAVIGFVYATGDEGNTALENARLKIFDNSRSSNPRLLEGVNSSSYSGYRIPLERNQTYLIEITKDGFLKESMTINTRGVKGNKTYRKDVYLVQKGITLTGKVYTQDEAGNARPYNSADISIIQKDITGVDKFVKEVTSTPEGYKVFLPSGAEYKIQTNVPNYLVSNYEIDARNTAGAIENKKDIILIPKKEGRTFKIDNIYYDTNSAKLRPNSYQSLNELISLLNANPGLRIEIGAHTDSSGETSYNQRLSTKRAESVLNYLAAAGIALDRLAAKGYGETQPIAPDDTEDNKQLNRRTEFKIISLN